MSTAIEYHLVQPDDIPRAYSIETEGFPPEEAASLESLTQRQLNASTLFLGAYSSPTSSTSSSSSPELIGYICSTRTPSSTLTHDSMSSHDPSGAYVAIHSVCVARDHLRRGIAAGLLKEYLERLKVEPGVKGARLITHEKLIGLYGKAGFELVGESEVVHGPEKWFEMKVDFEEGKGEKEKVGGGQEVEEEDEGEIRNPGKKLARVGGLADVVDKETKTNKADLFCIRPECRCLLLRAGAAKWVLGHHNDFQLPDLPRPIDAPVPASSTSQGYWSVPSPLTFENIGFSRNALPPSVSDSSSAAPGTITTSSTATIKYLMCADCDHGPLGWHDTEGRDLGVEVADENEGMEGNVRKGREFLLDVQRVRYRLKKE